MNSFKSLEEILDMCCESKDMAEAFPGAPCIEADHTVVTSGNLSQGKLSTQVHNGGQLHIRHRASGTNLAIEQQP